MGDRSDRLRLPSGFYSELPSKRVAALKASSLAVRDQVLADVSWPMYSPGSINSWLVFLGPSPGASPGKRPWGFDQKPSVGGPHLGVSEYEDSKGFWRGIRRFSRTIFPELAEGDAYAQTMLRNLDPASSAVGPTGSHMSTAANDVFDVLGQVIRPRLVIALGGARRYTDPVFRNRSDAETLETGALYTSKAGHERAWFSTSGTWASGEKYLYVSPSGVHPSLYHVSIESTLRFLEAQSNRARAL